MTTHEECKRDPLPLKRLLDYQIRNLSGVYAQIKLQPIVWNQKRHFVRTPLPMT
jgi:hypothetical protein